jgi:putative oxidoreductase
MKNLISKIETLTSNPFLVSVFLLLTRITLGGIFWRSATTRFEEGSWTTLNENAIYQFSDVPFNQVPVINGEFGAYFTTFSELAVSILLFLGFATRLSALATIGMMSVIQIFVFPTIPHLWGVVFMWAIMAIVLVAKGGGMFSVDRLFTKAG